MIEMVYKGTEKGKEGDKLQLPKNVRQIGEAAKGNKVYLEDYAVTYLHQVKLAILLGEVICKGEERYTFVQGAIGVEEQGFSDEAWENIYRDAKRYFEDCEILGWAMQVAEQPLTLTKEMDIIHKEHFKQEGVVLLLHEPCEKEDSLFVEENGALKKQNGYYVYYDKNKSMQEYMVEKNEGKSVENETQISDKAIKNFRKLTEEKRAKKAEAGKQTVKQPKMTRFLYTASTLLVLAVLVMGVTMLNNYDKIKGMEDTLAGIVNSTELQQANGNNVEVAKVKETQKERETETVLSSEETQDSETQTENVTVPETEANANVAEQTEAPQQTEASQQTETPEVTQTEAQAASAPVNHVTQSMYIVKAGDTLADICKMYYGNTDRLDEICELNGITDKNTILLGQKISLP